MKKTLLFSPAVLFFAAKISAQCITINCPGNVSANNDVDQCGAVVNFSTPVASSTCVGSVTDTFSTQVRNRLLLYLPA